MSAASLARSLQCLSLGAAPLVSSSHTVALRSFATQAAAAAVATTTTGTGPGSKYSPMTSLSFLSGRRGHATHASPRVGLGNLWPGLPTKSRRRVGRGPSSGRGGTSTRGHKGSKARTGNGKPVPGFEGGQTPLMRRFPKRGFTNAHAQDFVPINLDRIQHWIDRGLLDPSKPITIRELYQTRCVHSLRDGVKILGNGAKDLRSKVDLTVSRASQSAIAAIEALGGSVVCRYYTKLSLTALVKPEKFAGKLPPRPADPLSKRDLIWYSTPSNRGYLAKKQAIKDAEAQAQAQALELKPEAEPETAQSASS